MATVDLELPEASHGWDSQCAPRMTKAQRAKLKAAYRRDHPKQLAEAPEFPTSYGCWREPPDWWVKEQQDEQEKWARVVGQFEGHRAVAERVRGTFQKQLVLRKAERARSKEIRSTGREKGEGRTF
ncbi:hypothetical protein CLOM_g9664 [Closterium sp. NIES-68]|nr:hypothetical protein CLOM_g6311 [Closterium sp. NIES-68]GJP50501.1 hypothetical protein CLOM_g9664 [Closterium sp. NIES-68]GJP58508.1 hypothetical protein CLOP_g366 [Closterium sp. NIES-67]GJP84458.1 hypothetical protein CLOP_g14511 [Closterium sp. NIES-67]